jgi:septum formation topological specificity factor MinE
MEYKMREILLDALRKHAEGHVAKHKANVEVYLRSTTGIGEHPDIIESMEKEIMEIAKYNDVLEMIDKYFDPNNFVM